MEKMGRVLRSSRDELLELRFWVSFIEESGVKFMESKSYPPMVRLYCLGNHANDFPYAGNEEAINVV